MAVSRDVELSMSDHRVLSRAGSKPVYMALKLILDYPVSSLQPDRATAIMDTANQRQAFTNALITYAKIAGYSWKHPLFHSNQGIRHSYFPRIINYYVTIISDFPPIKKALSLFCWRFLDLWQERPLTVPCYFCS
jgi:hypothetical protein